MKLLALAMGDADERAPRAAQIPDVEDVIRARAGDFSRLRDLLVIMVVTIAPMVR